MGLFRIGKGIKNLVQGAIEGDIEKVGKGVIHTIVGVVTTVVGADDDDESSGSDD